MAKKKNGKWKFGCLFAPSQPDNIIYFNKLVDAYFDYEGYTTLFRLHVKSILSLEEGIKDEIDCSYEKNLLVVEQYNQKLIEQYCVDIADKCSLVDDKEEAFKCIAHHLEHETEEWIY